MRAKSVLLSLLSCAVALLPSWAQAPAAPEHIAITAKRFSFDPNQITLKKGQPVTLTLTSEDVTHGLAIKALGVKMTGKKGRPDDVTFTPEKTGTFEGKCSIFCGVHHGSMRMTVIVTD